MNYTLIAHEEDSSYFDRCGDFNRQPGRFETHFSTDRSEFAEQWALMQFIGSWDNLIVLLNGKPEEHFTEEEQKEYDELENLRYEAYLRHEEQKAQAREAQKRREEEEKERARVKAIERQRRADMAQLEALKKKLGVQ